MTKVTKPTQLKQDGTGELVAKPKQPKQDDTYNDLPVCIKCGWPMAGPYEIKRHRNDCPHVVAGASASALAARFSDLPSTKFGYGTGQLTFEPDQDLHVSLRCNDDETFALCEVWLLDDLTPDEAAGFVKAINDWRRECLRERNR